MKSVTTATAAAAIGISRKRLDNILVREGAKLIPAGARGRARHVSVAVVEVVALGMVLNRDLGSPVLQALDLAARLLSSSGGGTVDLGTLGRLSFDIARFRRAIEDAIAESIEQTPTPPRGRPVGGPGTARGRPRAGPVSEASSTRRLSVG